MHLSVWTYPSEPQSLKEIHYQVTNVIRQARDMSFTNQFTEAFRVRRLMTKQNHGKPSVTFLLEFQLQ